jgi:thioredoxin 1
MADRQEVKAPMPLDPSYHEQEPTREQVDRMPGPVLLEFGNDWCGHCQALSPSLARLLDQHPQVRHIRVADGRGKPLGRSFRVKLWPNLVFLRDGQVIQQLARPTPVQARDALEALVSE